MLIRILKAALGVQINSSEALQGSADGKKQSNGRLLILLCKLYSL